MADQISLTYKVVLAISAIIFLMAFWRPWLALVAWIATLSIQIPSGVIVDFRPAVSDVFVLPLVISALVRNSPTDGLDKYRDRLGILIWMFGACFLIVGNAVAYIHLGSLSKWTLLNKDAGLVVLMLCYFTAVHLLDSRERLQRAVEAFVVSGFALNLIALAGGLSRYAFGLHSDMMREATGTRLVGFMVNPSSYGGFLSCVALIQFALLLGNSSIVRLPSWLQWTNVFLLGLATTMTLARSAYIGFVAGLLALLLFHHGRATIRLILVAALVMVAVTTLLSVYSASDASRLFSTQVLNMATIEQRFDTFGRARDMFLESPVNLVFGIGVGTFYMTQSHFIFPLIIHNTYVWILVELGTIGFFVLLALLYRVLRDAHAVAMSKLPEKDVAVGVICAMVTVLIWFTGTEGLWHRHVWFLFALSQACIRIRLREKTARVTTVAKQPMRWQTPVMSH